jgi:hypothetical protein
MGKVDITKKIVYLLGAGASAGALPVISDIKTRMNGFWEYFKSVYKGPVKENFNKVHNEIQKHKSPDTFARICYLSNNGLLDYLKIYLSLYLLFEQLEKNEIPFFNNKGYADKTLPDKFHTIVDSRYISFISAIAERVNSKIELPQNLSFISWNYDSQFEIAYSKITGREQKLFEIRGDLGMLQNMTSTNEKNIRYVKINGSADFDKKESFDTAVELLQTDISRLPQLGGFLDGNRTEQSNLHFAWEENLFVNRAREEAKRMLSEANIIVIIGYSFPDFNRYVDKDLFSLTKPNKIYVQDLEPNNILEKLDGVKSGIREIAKPFLQKDQFIIPYEFWE